MRALQRLKRIERKRTEKAPPPEIWIYYDGAEMAHGPGGVLRPVAELPADALKIVVTYDRKD